MVKAWFFDEKIANPREPCQLENVSLEVVEGNFSLILSFGQENIQRLDANFSSLTLKARKTALL